MISVAFGLPSLPYSRGLKKREIGEMGPTSGRGERVWVGERKKNNGRERKARDPPLRPKTAQNRKDGRPRADRLHHAEKGKRSKRRPAIIYTSMGPDARAPKKASCRLWRGWVEKGRTAATIISCVSFDLSPYCAQVSMPAASREEKKREGVKLTRAGSLSERDLACRRREGKAPPSACPTTVKKKEKPRASPARGKVWRKEQWRTPGR